ncbi:GNAT family N-acetyltransferase [Flavobacterium sp. H122]|uniref:GNAT family N-acetyltransferase n=1 Tax=Flavobacterium sp. H122 TaxID=2529860 RepID=UPI0020BFB7BA|nr:GNAT family N-acetyltransferase [Flavobacterium sp. H122]
MKLDYLFLNLNMAIVEVSELDNPVWSSLTQKHREFAVSSDSVAFYQPEICPFGAVNSDLADSVAISDYATRLESFFIVGNLPLKLPDDIVLENEVKCFQMICNERNAFDQKEQIIQLKEENYQKLYDLVWLCLPGYFNKNTPLMGDYYGIFKDSKLVAVTGERMKLNKFTEISAVVTHPNYTRRGYSEQLVTYVTNKIFDENKIPFLHVSVTNLGAIKLYEKLGYSVRREMSFWKFKSTDK